MNILIFLIILLVLVVSHEFGHFIVAKKAGIRVDEFSFGFPPKLFGKKIGETTYNFNALPLGGYVKIFGESPDDESMAGPDSSRSFVNKPAYIQAAVLLAGVAMNFLIAWLLITGMYAFGTSIIFDDTLPAHFMNNTHILITDVSKGSPADTAGFKAGDTITSVSYADHSEVLSSYTTEAFTNFVRASNGAPLEIDVLRNATPVVIDVTPTNTTGHFMIGVAPTLQGYIKLPFANAITQGFHSNIALVKETFGGLAGLITRKESLNDVSGPVGLVSIVGVARQMGIEYLIFFVALISVNLAVINLIPFPALDGGRLLFLIIEKIKGSAIKPQVANIINSIGFGLLMLLMVIITYHDIVKLL
jgi:regulator of sigma E protease